MHKLWKDAANALGIDILPSQEHETLKRAISEMTEEANAYRKAHTIATSNRDIALEDLETEKLASQGLKDENILLKRDNHEMKLLVAQQAKRIDRLLKAHK